MRTTTLESDYSIEMESYYFSTARLARVRIQHPLLVYLTRGDAEGCRNIFKRTSFLMSTLTSLQLTVRKIKSSSGCKAKGTVSRHSKGHIIFEVKKWPH